MLIKQMMNLFNYFAAFYLDIVNLMYINIKNSK